MADVIFPAALALRALRSTSYKNTAHAVAELIDNSFDAEASQIGVALLVDQPNGQPHTIAVLDNGRGMSAETLRRSIQYGFSGEDSVRDKPLGKFGVGLVAASFSQCTDLRIMSWQDGETATGRVLATGIRIPEGEMDDADNVLPDPSVDELPEWAYRAFVGMASPIAEMHSGTLVVWRGVQPSWKRSTTLQENLSDLCGRIYRNFILEEKLAISVSVYNDTLGTQGVPPRAVPAVDPMFLTNWDDEDLSDFGFVDDNTMFDAFTGSAGDTGRNQAGDYEPELMKVKSTAGEIIGYCLLTASHRSPRVVDEDMRKHGDDPGDTRFGRLAKRLQGVSILRSRREIDLDTNWLRISQTVDRWVSVSLDFDPDLDDVFGVSNDKQRAHRLAETASLSLRDIRDRIKALEEEDDRDDRMLICLRVAMEIKTRLNEMQRVVREQRRGVRGDRDDESIKDPSAASVPELIKVGKRLVDGGHLPQDGTSPGDDPQGTADAYEGSTSNGMPAKDVRPVIVIQNELDVDVVADHQDISSRMFRVSLGPAHMVVHLIARHPLYDALSRLLLSDDDLDPDEPQATMQDALKAVRGLLISYARAQVEVINHNASQATEFERCSLKWGEVAGRLFRDAEE